MKKPDQIFTVYVCPVARLTSCPEKLAEEKRGLFGFHTSRCPHCLTVSDGFEVWGSNGHCQANLKTRANVVHWIKLHARKQWKTVSGETMGYKFKIGSELVYRAN